MPWEEEDPENDRGYYMGGTDVGFFDSSLFEEYDEREKRCPSEGTFGRLLTSMIGHTFFLWERFEQVFGPGVFPSLVKKACSDLYRHICKHHNLPTK